MAEANPLAQKITETILECAVCIEPFRDPRALPCQHGFCRDCLEQLAGSSEDKNTLECPTCRKTFQLPEGGVRNLPVHFYLSSLQDTVAMDTKVRIGFILRFVPTISGIKSSYNWHFFVCS